MPDPNHNSTGTGTDHNRPWTEQELAEEWNYIYEERLALLGVYDEVTPEQNKIAREEAYEAITKLKQQTKPNETDTKPATNPD